MVASIVDDMLSDPPTATASDTTASLTVFDSTPPVPPEEQEQTPTTSQTTTSDNECAVAQLELSLMTNLAKIKYNDTAKLINKVSGGKKRYGHTMRSQRTYQLCTLFSAPTTVQALKLKT